ncbi:MAG: DUF3037 domain-containing protein [Calditrichaeota bacterium]|nr:DUF3037 domain-containing protein [Calditrichota bacterium]RQV99684.1 MAG: DUF3037 domain-containing protein [Calditrichota bacterium]
MPDRKSFDYAIIRVVPFVERQEFINVGIIVFCRSLNYLRALIDFDLKRVASLNPQADMQMIRSQLQAILTICEGKNPECSLCKLTRSERFHWLTSPSSTIIQTSPVHSGLCTNPEEVIRKLYDFLVDASGKPEQENLDI